MKFKSDSQRRAVFSRLNRFSDRDKKIDRIGFKQPEVIKFKTRIVDDVSKNNSFSDDDEKQPIAMRRFKDKNMPKIGAGSDRRVYALDDEYHTPRAYETSQTGGCESTVVKVAKNKRGLEQNIYESDSFLDIMPEYHEGGADYVVVERADRDDKRSGKFLKPLIDFGHVISRPMTDRDSRKLHEFADEIGKIDEEYGTDMSDIVANYDFVYADIVRPKNWGWKDDMPKLIDKAAISGEYLNRDNLRRQYNSGSLGKDTEAYKHFMDGERVWDQEWRDVLAERRKARREGISHLSRRI